MLWYTAGPASLGREAALVEAGATGIRLCFSYDSYDRHEEIANIYRAACADRGRESFVVADLPGEKFRLAHFEGPPSIPIPAGIRLCFVRAQSTDVSSNHVLPVAEKRFFAMLEIGDIVVVGDGGAQLEIVDLDRGRFTADVVSIGEGTVEQLRGLTIRGSHTSVRAVGDKDLHALEFIVRAGCFDAVAVSFVSGRADISRVRDAVQGSASPIRVVAKVETPDGLARATEIAEAADFIMAARGDLALSGPWVDLALSVKGIAAAGSEAGTPWILGTQIAEGLERFSFPTRAEICDLWNWLECGCAGVLLAYETAFGSRPVDAVRCARMLIDRWEEHTGLLEPGT
jgi:pyruvate kinase